MIVSYPLVLRLIEILDEFVDLVLDIGNSEPFEEDLPQRAIGNIESRIGTGFLVAGRSVWKYWLRSITISVGLVAKRSLLYRVHFEL